MAVCHGDERRASWPAEEGLLDQVTVRLMAPEERERYDGLLEQEHYLGRDQAVGGVLRYVAEYQGQWVALLTFCSAALHLKPRDRFLHWPAREVAQRRHLIAQNSRFLILPSRGRWPNLASRVLKLVCGRLPEDWQHHWGHPVLLAETFVDPQRFHGTSYRAAGWQALGQTQGFERCGQDFYVDARHPKELWVRPLGAQALEQLRAPVLAPELQGAGRGLCPAVPIATSQLDSLWDFVFGQVKDPRKPRGVRHPIASLVCIATLAVGAGCQGPHAIALFARSLNHGQRRRLRCRPRRDRPREFEVPGERTLRRVLKIIPPEQLRASFSAWMASLDPEPVRVMHLDGKVL